MNMYRFIVLLVTLFLLLTTQGRADVTIAVIAPKAGDYMDQGTELFNGAKLAVDEINNNGGLNGEKVDMLTIDDQCDDRLAISTAQMLTLLNSKKIGLVVGPYCANRFNETATIYEKAQIFQIVPTTLLYHQLNADDKGALLMLGTKSQMSHDFFDFYNKNFAGLKVGFVYDDTKELGYDETAKSLFDEFKRYGKSALIKFYNFSLADGGSELAEKMVLDGINISFVLGKADDANRLIRKIKNKDKSQIVFTTKQIFEQSLKDEYFNGVYVMALPGLKDSLMFTESLVQLRLLGIEPKGLEVYSYVAVKLWGELVQKNKSFSYKKLTYDANRGDVKEKWSEFLMHSGSFTDAHYIIEQFVNNTYKQVY